MNIVTRIAAPLAVAFFAIGAQAQEVAPGDLGLKSSGSGNRAAAIVVAPGSTRSGEVAAGDLNLQPTRSSGTGSAAPAYSRRIDGSIIVGA
jgi:hypothetical protein